MEPISFSLFSQDEYKIYSWHGELIFQFFKQKINIKFEKNKIKNKKN